MGERVASQGHFALLRWRPDATRDEARNVAVLLAAEDGSYAGIRHAPLSSVSVKLRDQGILDDVLTGLAARLEDPAGSLELLQELYGRFGRSVVVTEPKPVAVYDPSEALAAMYRAYVAPRGGGSRAATKGSVLDKVVDVFREQGLKVRRGAYLDDFIFDVVLENGGNSPAVVEVLSFAAPRKDWAPVERDAGHFLYARRRLDVPGRAIIQPPTGETGAVESHDRIQRWLENDEVPSITVDDLQHAQQALDIAHA